MILMVSLTEFREIDYLLCWQAVSQTDAPRAGCNRPVIRNVESFAEELEV